MRTTVEIEDRVLDRAKRHAAQSGRSLGELVTEALASYMSLRSKQPAVPFELLVRGSRTDSAPSPSDLARAEEEDEVASLRIPGVRGADS
ncbi:MAG: hypothetical protein HYV07_18875 [Deltaproteobacteria bacterium]|nr:hypothetical protein [Deltaproteobacteria bacterium]